MAVTDDDVREILRLIDESELHELRIETAGFKLHVVRGGAPAADPPAESPEPRRAAPVRDGALRTIDAPMPGTFYRAEGPNSEPLVEVGDQVEPDTVVGILEIMKMMNSIQADVAGTIVELCADDAQLMKEGEPLFRVRAAP